MDFVLSSYFLHMPGSLRSVWSRCERVTQETDRDQPEDLPGSYTTSVRIRSHTADWRAWFLSAFHTPHVLFFPTFLTDTSRPRKMYEEPGREYHFISRDQFDSMVYNNRYMLSHILRRRRRRQRNRIHCHKICGVLGFTDVLLLSHQWSDQDTIRY